MPHRIASAKIPEDLLEAVDKAARQRGLSRNAYMRRALEAATDGTLELQSDDARTRDLFRAGLRADTERLRQAFGTTTEGLATFDEHLADRHSHRSEPTDRAVSSRGRLTRQVAERKRLGESAQGEICRV